jgi:LmbE family N-acetylglucosaminyl deacetylase
MAHIRKDQTQLMTPSHAVPHSGRLRGFLHGALFAGLFAVLGVLTLALVVVYREAAPVREQAKTEVASAPPGACTQPRQVISTGSLFKPSESTPSVFQIVRGPRKPAYEGCSIAGVATINGTPRMRAATESEAGVRNTPDVLQLLHGKDGSQSLQKAPEPVPVVEEGPKKVAAMSRQASCAAGTTLNVVAHQDDDLLFMNPDLTSDITEDRCIRTVYLTAGDAGESTGYWNGRELGAKAAYARMYDVADSWHDEQLVLADKTVTVSFLDAVPRVSLVFLRLPDGNLLGQGFTGTKNESLHALLEGVIPAIHTVDTASSYTRDELRDLLHGLMVLDTPDRIRTHNAADAAGGDHSDHYAAGALTSLAAAAYQQPHTVIAYVGYPNKLIAPNLSEDQVALKQIIFLTYAGYDGAVCQTAVECGQTVTYGSYLARQYTTRPAVIEP